MRSLFLKIFLWFWLANAILVAVLVAANYWILSPGGPPGRKEVLDIVGKNLSLAGRLAVDTLDRDGEVALDRFLAKTGAETGVPMILLDAAGHPLAGESVPDGAQTSIKDAIHTGEAGVDRAESSAYVTQPFRTPDGRQFMLLGSFPAPFARADMWRSLVLHLLAAVLTAGGVCYALARHLTAPVRRLQSATWRLADGQLDARVQRPARGRRDELGDLERDFDYMAERIATLIKTQRRLFWDISHELRSPLARICVAVGLARRGEGSDQNTAIDQIDRDAERLNDLIKRLLTLARLESGLDQGPPSSLDLAALIREIVADAQFEAASRGCRVRVIECDACSTTGSPELIRSAIENVVRNALAYTAADTEVELRFRRESGKEGPVGTLTVRDHGPGVQESELAEIFRPFHRASNSRRQNGSSGLGLSIAERAIRSHGGVISASNASDGGLIVQICFPIDAA